MKISFSSSLDYGSRGRECTQSGDLADVSKADLIWYYFLGRLSISHGGVEIGPPWGWVPLFDAMYAVQEVMVFARGGNALGKIDFTENPEFISFELDRDFLRMTPTYLEATLRCSVDEFVDAGTLFIAGELQRVMREYPSLTRNREVHALARDVGLEVPDN
ncbi:hypothetical protein [Amycolatopsis sp. GA6-003]|uniref:hypothetical protein n=1 Tax=Amycolatopsis sp. GA6-003 TaxID=2652444 RepID=UPI003916EEA5